jgi:hypothetical protein
MVLKVLIYGGLIVLAFYIRSQYNIAYQSKHTIIKIIIQTSIFIKSTVINYLLFIYSFKNNNLKKNKIFD